MGGGRFGALKWTTKRKYGVPIYRSTVVIGLVSATLSQTTTCKISSDCLFQHNCSQIGSQNDHKRLSYLQICFNNRIVRLHFSKIIDLSKFSLFSLSQKKLIFHAQIHNAPLLVPLAAVFHLVLNQKLFSNQIIGPVLAIKNHN